MADKMKPRILSGFMELLPKEQILFNKMYDTIREVYESFGFLPLDTPVIELSEILLAKAGGETEKQIYRFTKGDNDLSLRFDLTVPLARYVAQHYGDLVFPFKRYQMSKVYRGERPQKGRFREFYQCDIDIIGNEELSLVYDAEMPAVIYNVFKKLDFGKFTVRINNRKILNGFFSSLGLSEKVSDILRTIDKIEKIGRENVEKELAEYEIQDDDVKKILDFVSIGGNNDEKTDALKKLGIDNEMYCEGVKEIEEVCGYMRNFGIDESYFMIDRTIARGLDYYTGTVYETVLDDYRELGSVCSGGRYDNLTEFYTKQKLPGIGISIGLTRLFSQLIDKKIISAEEMGLVDVLVVPMGEIDSYVLGAADKIREIGLKTDVYYGAKGMKQKMKYADKCGIAYAAIIGEDEEKGNFITIKGMKSGEQKQVPLDDIKNAF